MQKLTVYSKALCGYTAFPYQKPSLLQLSTGIGTVYCRRSFFESHLDFFSISAKVVILVLWQKLQVSPSCKCSPSVLYLVCFVCNTVFATFFLKLTDQKSVFTMERKKHPFQILSTQFHLVRSSSYEFATFSLH